ncbi:hypothetical protein [Streptococcus dysgalactiae]|nr:hypothetical protein [Streptococcus dysgalactiae]
MTNCFINECLLSLSMPTGTVGIEPTYNRCPYQPQARLRPLFYLRLIK